MSLPRKQLKFLESTNEHYDGGQNLAKSSSSKPHRVKEDITSKVIQLSLFQTELMSYTPELAQGRKNQTLKDKLLLSAVDTQKQKSSQKLVEDLTSKGRKCLPYWDESCRELSSVLSSLTKIDSQDSDLTCFDGSANKTGANSWFSMKQHLVQNKKWLKTSSPSSIASHPDCMDLGSTKLRCRKIQIYPSPELNKMWRQWLAACRYCFNQAMAWLKDNRKLIAKRKLRNIIMQSDLPDWVKQSPCHIRQNAVFEAHQAYKASKKAKFRSCREGHQTIKFNNCNFSNGRWYPTKTKKLDFKASETIPDECAQATGLTWNKGRWFATFPAPVEPVINKSDGIIALDPGVRCFQTGFDGQRFIEFGKGDIGRITRLCQHLDNLMSKISQATGRKRQSMRKAAGRMRNRIRNLIDEAHRQIAHYLTSNYKVIFLPTFETSQMVAKSKRKIRSKTARQMLSWAHYRFSQVLANQAELTQTRLIEGSEAYTSKTCTKCGHIHTTLGGSKVFKCPSCGHKLPRDWNGALGYMLRALRDTSFTVSNDGVAIAALSSNYLYCVA
jgi:putative transposase